VTRGGVLKNLGIKSALVDALQHVSSRVQLAVTMLVGRPLLVSTFANLHGSSKHPKSSHSACWRIRGLYISDYEIEPN